MRQFTIYATVGQQTHVVDTHGSNWGEVQQELRAAGVKVDGMKAITGESQITLESAQAVIPTTESTIFLLPQKVKSGYHPDDYGDDEDCGCEDEDDDTPLGRVKAKVQEIGQGINELYSMLDELGEEASNPAVQHLKSKADELKKNLGLWD